MASVSVSHLILFIASMVVAASVAGVLTESVGQLGGAITDMGGDVSSEVRTDVEVISDAGSDALYDDATENLTLHVKNTGSRRLAAEADVFSVFVDGAFEGNLTVSLLGSADSWHPGEVVSLEVSHQVDPGDHRVKVIVDGDEEVFEFRT